MTEKATASKTTESKNNTSPTTAGRTGVYSRSSPQAQFLQLHSRYGNRVVQRMYQSGVLQAKLTIGQPGDRYEREADSVADQVMAMPDPKLQRQEEEEEEEKEEPQAKPDEKRTQTQPTRPKNPQARAFYSTPPAQIIDFPIQTKVAIGRPNDPYEREADDVADRVVGGQPIAAISTLPPGGLGPRAQRQEEGAAEEEDKVEETSEGSAQPKLIQCQAEGEEEEEAEEASEGSVQPQLMQRQEEGAAEEEEKVEETPEGSAQPKLIQRQAEEASEEEPETVQPLFVNRQAEEEEETRQEMPLQRQVEEPSEEETVQDSALQRQEDENESVQSMIRF